MLMGRIEPPQSEAPMRGKAWRMVARAATALFGGYSIAAAFATLVARLLPGPRVEAVLWGMILAFAIYAGAALWCFREPRLGRVLAIMWSVALVAGGSAWLLGVRP